MRQCTVLYRQPVCSLVIGLTLAATACQKSRDNHAGAGDSAGPAAPASTNSTAGADIRVVVNDVVLLADEISQLQRLYPVTIEPGRYWYDAVSGGYGREGEPIAGQMIPGLSLGGPLAPTASRGTSGVFINGRQITGGEKAYLEQLCRTPVELGRYWVMANGVGGYEGQPANFNLAQCPGVPQQGGGARSMSKTYCDANGSCTSTGILGSIITAPN